MPINYDLLPCEAIYYTMKDISDFVLKNYEDKNLLHIPIIDVITFLQEQKNFSTNKVDHYMYEITCLYILYRFLLTEKVEKGKLKCFKNSLIEQWEEFSLYIS